MYSQYIFFYFIVLLLLLVVELFRLYEGCIEEAFRTNEIRRKYIEHSDEAESTRNSRVCEESTSCTHPLVLASKQSTCFEALYLVEA